MPTETAPPPATPTQTLKFEDFTPKERPTREPRQSRESASPVRQAPESPKSREPAAPNQEAREAIEAATPKKFEVPGTFTEALDKFTAKNKDTLAREIQDSVTKAPTRQKDGESEATKPDAKKLLHSDITADSTDDQLETIVETNASGLSAKQLHHFKTLTYETREQKRSLKEMEGLKARLAEYEGKPPVDITPLQKELEAAKKRTSEQETELGATRFEKTEVFQREVAVPMQNIENQFREIATEFELSPDAIADAAKLRGKARGAALAELTLEMTDYDRSKFYGLVDQYSALHDKRADIQAKGKESWDAYVAGQEQTRQAKALTDKADYENAVPEAWEEDIAKHLPFLKPVDGDAEWNARLEKTQAFAKSNDIRALGSKEAAAAAHRVAVYPLLVDRIQELETKLAAKSEKVESLKAAKPANGSGRVNGAPAEKDDSNETFTDRFAKFRAARGIR